MRRKKTKTSQKLLDTLIEKGEVKRLKRSKTPTLHIIKLYSRQQTTHGLATTRARAYPAPQPADLNVKLPNCTAHNTTYNNRVGEEGKHIECFGSEAMQASDGRADLNLCYYFKRQGRRKHRGANTECCNTAKLLTSSPGHKALAYML